MGNNMSNNGKFEGEVVTKWLKNSGKDRDMKLTEDFFYIDPNGKKWAAKAGAVVNGASIPAFLWGNWLGSPFVGDYRRATVLHDVGCEEKTETSSEVHKMFYHAMLCDGVKKSKAYKMYKAVDWFGPDWGVDVHFRSMGAKRLPNINNLDQLDLAVDSALEELGVDVSLEELDRKVEQIMNM